MKQRYVNRTLRWLLFMSSVFCLQPAVAEEITWDRSPIQLSLVVGVESRIDFPGEVRIGLPADISDKETLLSESLDGSAYFTAIKPFSKKRVYATLVKSGKMLLFDVTARAPSKSETNSARSPLKVIVSESMDDEDLVGQGRLPSIDAQAITANSHSVDAERISPIGLCRFAAQQLYAPIRLLPRDPNIQRVPMRTPKILSQLYVGDEVRPEAIASWSGGGIFVTAVKISNLSKAAIALDPRKLRGKFMHAAFQDKSMKLGPSGTATDTTTIYLITDRPFADSVTLKG